MKTKLFLLSFALIAFTFSSCKKGDTGAQGPAGSNGSNGSANVTNTTFTATPGTWNFSSPWYYITVAVPAITNGDLDLVQAYVQVTGGGPWWNLPASSVAASGDSFSFNESTGQVQLYYTNSSAPSGTWNFRIVTIPPAVAHANPDVRYSNYEEVKRRFNLKD